MEIVIKREIVFRHALHGRLYIGGERLCDTLENEITCWPPGRYPILRPKRLFVPHNGIHRLGDSIAVGEWEHLGFLLRTQSVHDFLQHRLSQLRYRHQEATLIIEDEGLREV